MPNRIKAGQCQLHLVAPARRVDWSPKSMGWTGASLARDEVRKLAMNQGSKDKGQWRSSQEEEGFSHSLGEKSKQIR